MTDFRFARSAGGVNFHIIDRDAFEKDRHGFIKKPVALCGFYPGMTTKTKTGARRARWTGMTRVNVARSMDGLQEHAKCNACMSQYQHYSEK